MAQLNFDASQVQPDSGLLDPVPKGWYNVVIDETEMKPTSKGDGYFLNVRHNILDGQYAGRKVFARINVRNPNPQAQEIGYKQLSAICHAVGVIQVADSSQLHNIPLKIRIKIRTDKTGEYDDQNDITAWKNINEQVPMGPATPAGAAPTFAPTATPMAPPQAPAQQWQQPAQQFAPPQQQAPQQTPPQAPQQQWTPPGGQQPWQQPPAQQQPQFTPPAQQAPAPQQFQAPQQQFAPPPQASQPPQQQAPAQAPAQAPVQGQQPPPWAGAQQATPPWQQPQQ